MFRFLLFLSRQENRHDNIDTEKDKIKKGFNSNSESIMIPTDVLMIHMALRFSDFWKLLNLIDGIETRQKPKNVFN